MTAGSPAQRRTTGIVAALLAAVVLIIVIVAFAAGNSQPTNTTTLTRESRIPQNADRQVSPANVAGTALPRFDSLGADVAAGMDAPEFTASYFDNTETTISPGDGKPRIILFLAHWCPHCQAEVSSITDWAAENDLPKNLEVVAISTGVDQGAPNYPPSEWLRREDWPFPVLRDSAQGDLAVGYGLSSYPYLVAIDADGKVVTRNSGSLQPGQWESIVAALTT